MAGIYIHVPFCVQRCHYCDFYSTVNLSNKSLYLSALEEEIQARKNYLNNEKIESIYFGGGTPSILKTKEIDHILQTIFRNFNTSESVEITLEANPDDLSKTYLNDLFNTSINRLSIGIQSFDDNYLSFMNRRHTAIEAINSVENAKKKGFNNISIDLIYGLPEMDLAAWSKTIDKALSLDIQHISAYHLTYEANTVLDSYLLKGKIKKIGEELSIQKYIELLKKLEKNDFIAYEISNFGKKGFYSKHNSSYWQQKKYLGLGPSAHSFNLKSRRWNNSSLKTYLTQNKSESNYYSVEYLTDNDRFNEYLLTGLRTIEGIDLEKINNNFTENYLDFILSETEQLIHQKLVIKNENILTLSLEGRLLADKIISDLFFIL